MNYSTAIFLISDKARAIGVTYEPCEGANIIPYKTLDPDIKVGDYVVVPTTTRHKMTVCKVVEVDMEPDLDSNKEMKWLVGTVDPASVEEIKKQEEDAITAIRSAEKRRKREELREALLADTGDAVKALPIYSDDTSGTASK